MEKFYEWLSRLNEQETTNPQNTNELEKLANQAIFESNRVQTAKNETAEIIKKIDEYYQDCWEHISDYQKDADINTDYSLLIDPKTNDYASASPLLKDYESRLKNMSLRDIFKQLDNNSDMSNLVDKSELFRAAVKKKILILQLEELRIHHSIIKNSYTNILPRVLPYVIALRDLKTPEAVKANNPDKNFDLPELRNISDNPKLKEIMSKYYKPAKDLPQFYSPRPPWDVSNPDPESTPQEALNKSFISNLDAIGKDNGKILIAKVESHFGRHVRNTGVMLKKLDNRNINLSEYVFIEDIYLLPCVFKDKSIEEDFIQYVAEMIKPAIMNNIKHGIMKHGGF